MTNLIDRIEGAETGSRVLDEDVVEACGECARRNTTYYCVQGDSGFDCDDCGKDPNRPGIPRVTTSLDAALALAERVRPGWGWSAGGPLTACDEGAYARLDAPDGYDFEEAYAKTPALALCAAILRAKEQGNGDG